MFLLTLAGLALLTGCSGGPASVACPAMAARAGIGLDIEAPLAAKVVKATVDGKDVHLDESTAAVPSTCPPGKPDQPCSAKMVRTGAKNGFLDQTGLKLEPMRLSVRLTDAAGAVLVDQDIQLTPKEIFPAGAHCGGGQPQAGVLVAADGTMRQRP
ncbi:MULTISPECIES: hypothetical protein [unclassified Crossiella]|uniref:hypothetical protein n=1 Tax=unclassified Crossiella TaxID=2620835 RepID=UPI001FFE4BCB|nr:MULTISPECIES: hypothetical protein [unclassified Crossiella]MCK2244537.1 hypothetical protein [Crossiella sp. S99.2]MCK2258168.1 hypothetical protein [Crossiella sp. S99.1]